MRTTSYKIAYVSRVIYPSSMAHAAQTLQMAAAFANQTNDTGLFVRDLARLAAEILCNYAVPETRLHFWSLHANRIPAPIRGYYGHTAIYNSMIAAILAMHPAWRQPKNCRKVLFNRGVNDYTYWGLVKPHLSWLREWLLVYEAHDIAGLDSLARLEQGESGNKESLGKCQHRLQVLRNYDLIVCVTQALADDLQRWSNGALQPQVVRHASSLPRLPHPPETHPFGKTVVLGYIGTIDTYRGVDTLLKAMRLLPGTFHLRLVGAIPGYKEDGQYPDWLAVLMNDPEIRDKIELIPRVPLSQVTGEIDRCDILLQTASSHIYTLRYAAPLKSFDYMVRGKPIVAADAPCHRELFQDGVNAQLYRHDDADHLAVTIQSLAAQPEQALAIAAKAWEQSAQYTYPARAQRILELVDEAWERCHAKHAI
ncbi:MAG: glycosyltransferase family 4 protein [Anaerolineales bacterium]|nr:glycosyltransferase family 4 protein [Anaerolineales bacterium]